MTKKNWRNYLLNHNLGVIIIFLALSSSCSDKGVIIDSNIPCTIEAEIRIISDGKKCDDTDSFLICEQATVFAINQLQSDDFDWIPMICNEIGESIEFKNDKNEVLDFTISKRDHYINKKRLNIACSPSMEHVSLICQRNETVVIEFETSLFDTEKTYFELFRQVDKLKNDTLGEAKLFFNIGQPRSNSEVYNFYFRVNVEDRPDNRAVEFQETKTLNGIEYSDVFEFKIRESYWDEPHIFMYVNEEYGIFGFKNAESTWIIDH